MDLQHVLRRHKTWPPHCHPDVPELTSGMEGTGQHGSLWLSAPGLDLSPSHGGGHWRAHAESRVGRRLAATCARGATAPFAPGRDRCQGASVPARRGTGCTEELGASQPMRLAPSRRLAPSWRLAPALCTPHPCHGPRPEPSRPPGGRQQPAWRSRGRPADGAVGPCLVPSWRARSLVPLLVGLAVPLPGWAFSRGAPQLL